MSDAINFDDPQWRFEERVEGLMKRKRFSREVAVAIVKTTITQREVPRTKEE